MLHNPTHKNSSNGCFRHSRETLPYSNAFTLIELLLVIVVGALLTTLAVPSFNQLIQNNRIISNTNLLVTDINLARSEAIKRGTRVILCRSANPTDAVPTCGGTSNTWTTGWLLFASGDGNNTYESATDTLLRVGLPPSSSDITIITNSTSNNNLEFNADGSTNEAGGTAMFAVCDDRGKSRGNQIQVSPTGRPRLISPVPNSCSNPS